MGLLGLMLVSALAFVSPVAESHGSRGVAFLVLGGVNTLIFSVLLINLSFVVVFLHWGLVLRLLMPLLS